MQASPKQRPLLSDNRMVPVGEIGQVIREEKCPDCAENGRHDRFWIKFSDGETVVALRGYLNFHG